jgi:tetratricopeptide (TPR) repeat protein
MRSLYDAMDNDTRNDGKRAVVSRLVMAAARIRPLLAIVEDVHWADALTLSYLSTLTKTVADCPALLLTTSRIEGDPLDREWLTSTEGSPFFTIDLGPLREQDSIALIEEYIDADDSLAASCLERAAGNPLFLEQLLRNAQEGTTGGLPDSIQSLVLARMDRLDVEDKRALQAASVMGQRFAESALNHMLGTTHYDMGVLLEHNLVRRERTGYLFAHALIQEGVYASLIKQRREELHRKAASWFADSDLVLHAEHLGAANDDLAPPAFAAAAREQAEQYRIERALDLVERGLTLVSEEDSFELRYLQGELLRRLGATTESMDAYRLAEQVATSDSERCQATIGIAEGHRTKSEYEELLRLLEGVESIAQSQGLCAELARIAHLKGNAHFIRGEVEDCLRSFQSALDNAEKAGATADIAQALGGLADAEFSRGRILSALDYYDRCVEMSREHGFGRNVAANLSMRGNLLVWKNELDAALLDCREARELAEQIHQPRAEMMANWLGALVLTERGELDEAERWGRRGMELARRLESQLFEGVTGVYLARTIFYNGKLVEARELMSHAYPIVQELGMDFIGANALGLSARLTDDPEERLAALNEAEKLLADSAHLNDSWFDFFRDAIELSLEQSKWDEADRYAGIWEEQTAAEPTPGSEFYIARGRALAAKGRGNTDSKTVLELERLLDEAKRVGLRGAVPALEQALSSS